MTLKQSGILLHITSLPGNDLCGTLGKEAHGFLDFLKAAGQKNWQILPTCPVDRFGSPYSSSSSRAGSHLLIDLQPLVEAGYLASDDLPSRRCDRVDYSFAASEKDRILRLAYKRAASDMQDVLAAFCLREGEWLADHALFTSLHTHFGTEWQRWDAGIRDRTHDSLAYWRERLADEIGYRIFVQYFFFTQWDALREHAKHLGIRIIGDLPIYVSRDSADVWANREFFDLDEKGYPNRVGGVPPDIFSADGQNWGNPIYRWDVLKQYNFSWWIDRLRHAMRLCDVLRLDHFRGFESFWAVDGDCSTAVRGEWLPGPGMQLFLEARKQLGELSIIAEDLGIITDEVNILRRECGFPGMRVLQFAFDGGSSNPHLPHNYSRDTVAYTGTHDNNTLLGYAAEIPHEQLEYMMEYLNSSDFSNLSRDSLFAVWSSDAELAIAQMQDVLSLDAKSRMNTPGTTEGNWAWRMNSMPDAECTEFLTRLTEISER